MNIDWSNCDKLTMMIAKILYLQYLLIVSFTPCWAGEWSWWGAEMLIINESLPTEQTGPAAVHYIIIVDK